MGSRANFLSSLARQPLVHFLVIGLVIGALNGWWGARGPARSEAAEKSIRVSAEDVRRMEAEWLARWNRPPTPDERDALIRASVRETALYREALAMGLDQDDPVIRRLLVQKLEALVRDLVELGLAPTDQELAEYLAENAERYRPPALITFSQVFVDPDRHGDRTLEDAQAMLAELRALEDPTASAEGYGDPSMLQSYYPEKPERRIASLFGREFASSVFELEPGRWRGPVSSRYGTHLVFVDEVKELPLPELEDVRDAVTQDWMDQRRRAITEEYFAELLADYDVILGTEGAEE